MRSNKGGITVLLAVIFMSLLIFAGSFIDIARIAVAERKVESALASAVRSTLAGYDADLVGEFGIFGLETGADPGDIKKRFRHYFRLNLAERHKGIRFILYDIQEDKLAVEGLGSLAGKEVLKHQILEYMKYKAPVALIENGAESVDGSIIAKLKKARLGQKMEYAGKEKAVRTKQLALEAKLGQLNGRIGGIKENVRELTEEGLKALQKSVEEALASDLPQSGSAYDGYTGARQQSEDFLDRRDPADEMTNRESGMEPNESTEFDHVNGDRKEAGASLERYKEEIGPAAGEIASLRTQINSLQSRVDRMQQSIASLENRIAALQRRENPPADTISAMEEQISGYLDQIPPLEQQIGEKEQEIVERLSSLQNRLWGIPLETVRLNEDSRESPKRHSAETEEKKRGFDRLVKDITAKLTSLGKHIEPEWLISGDEFATVKNEDDKKIEEMKEAAMAIGDRSRGDACEASYDHIADYMKALQQMMVNNTLDMRDKLYITEYAMDKFTFLTSKTERGRYFNRGEIEYILAGRDIPYDGNKNGQALVVAEVLSRVWFLRFAIDTVDSFATNKIPDPLARLAWALAEGAVQACIDMMDMLAGKPVAICPSCTAIRLQYSDHLRFLLLMQDEDITIRRIQQLMQINIKNAVDAASGEKRADFRLSNLNTAVRAEAEVHINLWFLAVLNPDKAGFRNFKGGRYIVNREVYIGY